MRITLPTGTPAELIGPSQGEPVAGLVVIPDIMGLRPLFVDLCQRLADEYRVTVCCAEPFPHQDLPTIEDRFAALASLVDDDVLGDVSAAADATRCARVVVIGFCMGGMYTLKATGLGRFDRACAFYGMFTVPPAWKGVGHGEPLDAVTRAGATPVMAIVGGRDPYTPAPDVLAATAAGVTVVVYPDADHGFVHDPSRPVHRADDAADAWARCMQFLAV